MACITVLGTACAGNTGSARGTATPSDASAELSGRIESIETTHFHASFRVDDTDLATPDDPGPLPFALDWYEDGTNRRFDIHMRLASGGTATLILFVDPNGDISGGCREESDPAFVPFCSSDHEPGAGGELVLISLVWSLVSIDPVQLPAGSSVMRSTHDDGGGITECYGLRDAGSTVVSEQYCFDNAGLTTQITLSNEPGQQRVLTRERLLEAPSASDFLPPFPTRTVPTPAS